MGQSKRRDRIHAPAVGSRQIQAGSGAARFGRSRDRKIAPGQDFARAGGVGSAYKSAVSVFALLPLHRLISFYAAARTGGRFRAERFGRAEAGKVAKEIGCSSTQVAINWVRKKYENCIPILGATKVKQLEDNIDCLKHDLTDKQIAQLDDVSKIELGFPHEFLKDDNPGLRKLKSHDDLRKANIVELKKVYAPK